MPDVDIYATHAGGLLGPALVSAACLALILCGAIACTRGIRQATCSEHSDELLAASFARRHSD